MPAKKAKAKKAQAKAKAAKKPAKKAGGKPAAPKPEAAPEEKSAGGEIPTRRSRIARAFHKPSALLLESASITVQGGP